MCVFVCVSMVCVSVHGVFVSVHGARVCMLLPDKLTCIHTPLVNLNCCRDNKLVCLLLLLGNVVWLDKMTSIRAMLKLSSSRDDVVAAETKKKEERKESEEEQKGRGEKRGKDKKKGMEETHEGKGVVKDKMSVCVGGGGGNKQRIK